MILKEIKNQANKPYVYIRLDRYLSKELNEMANALLTTKQQLLNELVKQEVIRWKAKQ